MWKATVKVPQIEDICLEIMIIQRERSSQRPVATRFELFYQVNVHPDLYPVYPLCHTRLASAPCQLRIRIHWPLLSLVGKMPLRCYKSRPTVYDKDLEVFWGAVDKISLIWWHPGVFVLDTLSTAPPHISFRSADLASYRHRPLDRPFVI